MQSALCAHVDAIDPLDTEAPTHLVFESPTTPLYPFEQPEHVLTVFKHVSRCSAVQLGEAAQLIELILEVKRLTVWYIPSTLPDSMFCAKEEARKDEIFSDLDAMTFTVEFAFAAAPKMSVAVAMTTTSPGLPNPERKRNYFQKKGKSEKKRL